MGLFDKKAGWDPRRRKDINDVGILVVDDLKEHRELYREILAYDGFSNIHMAGTGAECLSILAAKGNEIFVVLLDRILPDDNGDHIVQFLLNDHRNLVGIVINTAFPTDESRNDFFNAESENVYPTAYLDKADFDIEVLSAKVRNTAEQICKKRAYMAEQNVEVAQESIRSIKQQLTRMESEVRNDISHLHRRMPSYSKATLQAVSVTVMLGLFVWVEARFGFIAEIPGLLEKLAN